MSTSQTDYVRPLNLHRCFPICLESAIELRTPDPLHAIDRISANSLDTFPRTVSVTFVSMNTLTRMPTLDDSVGLFAEVHEFVLLSVVCVNVRSYHEARAQQAAD